MGSIRIRFRVEDDRRDGPRRTIDAEVDVATMEEIWAVSQKFKALVSSLEMGRAPHNGGAHEGVSFSG